MLTHDELKKTASIWVEKSFSLSIMDELPFAAKNQINDDIKQLKEDIAAFVVEMIAANNVKE